MNLIQALLAGQAGLASEAANGYGQTGARSNEGTYASNEPPLIDVLGRPNLPVDLPAQDQPPEPPRADRPKRQRVFDNSRDHEGLLGVHGGLRDILGAFGDAFGKRGPVYEKRRKDERMSDALVGFTENPLKAFERLADIPGGAEMAQKAYHDYTQAQSVAESRDASEELAKGRLEDLNRKNGYAVLGSYVGTINKDPVKYQKMLPMLRRIMEAKGLTDVELPDAYGPDAEDSISIIRELGLGGPAKATRLEQQGDDTESRIEDRRARQGLTARGQDITSANNVRSTSTSAANNQRSVAATVRGQDMTQSRYDSGQQGKPSRINKPATGPKPGFKKGGYTFTGGDPANPKSWKKD